MSTAHLNENQQKVYNTLQLFERLGGAEGYRASLEAAKSSNTAPLPDIAPGEADGAINVEINFLPFMGHYSVTLVINSDGPTYTGGGVGDGPNVKPPLNFAAKYLLLEGTTLDDLLGKQTKCSWYPGGTSLVAVVFSMEGKALLHILDGPLGTGLENTNPILVWNKS